VTVASNNGCGASPPPVITAPVGCTSSSRYYRLCTSAANQNREVCYNGTKFDNFNCVYCVVGSIVRTEPVPNNGQCQATSTSTTTRKSCVCPFIYQPQCGVDGRQYGNSCQRACAGVDLAYDGQCQGITFCSDSESAAAPFCNNRADNSLVCGDDGKQYYNTYCAQVQHVF
jgi:hypothetical protein